MPTRPGFDLVPVRKETKMLLARLKGDGTFDEAIRALLEGAAPVEPVPAQRMRDPQEQVALAELAAKRWELAKRSGEIVDAGPRLILWYPKKGVPSDVRYTWPSRRGLPA